MKSTFDFIVKQDNPFNDTITTKNGAKLYLDKRFSQEKLVNKEVDVVETPFLIKTSIKVGDKVLIDPTIFHNMHNELAGEIENPNIVDKKQGHYKISPEMIVCFKDKKTKQWQGFQNNIIVEKIVNEENQTQSGLILEQHFQKFKKDRAIINISNEKLELYGVSKGTEVAIEDDYLVPFYIDGKEYFWCNNEAILGYLN